MPETARGGAANFLERNQLVKLKMKAMRAGVWFKALRKIDRVLFDLTIKVADGIRSPRLARCIIVVAGKLENALENKLGHAVREFGFPLARKLSLFAQKWGNKAAVRWAVDPGFARYWAVMKLNGHPCAG